MNSFVSQGLLFVPVDDAKLGEGSWALRTEDERFADK